MALLHAQDDEDESNDPIIARVLEGGNKKYRKVVRYVRHWSVRCLMSCEPVHTVQLLRQIFARINLSHHCCAHKARH